VDIISDSYEHVIKVSILITRVPLLEIPKYLPIENTFCYINVNLITSQEMESELMASKSLLLKIKDDCLLKLN